MLLLFFLPWLDRCRVKSIRYRGWIYKLALMVFAVEPSSRSVISACSSRRGPVVVLLPDLHDSVFRVLRVDAVLLRASEKTKPVPTRVTW